MYFCHFTVSKTCKGGKIFADDILLDLCVSYLRRTWITITLLNRRIITYVFCLYVTPDWPWALHLLSPLIRLLLRQLINRLSLLRPGQIILCNIYYRRYKGRTKMKWHAALQSEPTTANSPSPGPPLFVVTARIIICRRKRV